MSYLKNKNNICIYDPCCGSSYIPTVFGFLFNEIIKAIYCSDISQDAIGLSYKNLSLLSFSGIESRKNEISNLINNYDKDSHRSALNSIDRLSQLLKNEITGKVFFANILNKNELRDKTFIADIVITDVPYNNLVDWSVNTGNEINELLNGIIPIINSDTIITVIHDKKQKAGNPKYTLLEKIQIGHRKIEIMKLVK